MKRKVTVSNHGNVFASVKECVAHRTVADSSSLELLNSRNGRSFSFASCGKDHADSLEISGSSLYLEGIKSANAKNLGIQNPHAKSLRLG